ncbi:unnamed protein product [Paramecium octaurelia]|uniref:Uncharacterized protein n=1 Tax=Paramecium octaurelia TaxID=43137 RepID=A0A8S1UBG1_PAROT|nr:unnamed protein product [Paramecium octaurelia]
MSQLFTNPLIFSNLIHQPQPFTQHFHFQNPLQTYYSQFQVPCNFAPIHNHQSEQYIQLQLPFNGYPDYGNPLTYPIINTEISTTSQKTSLAIADSQTTYQIMDPFQQHLPNKQKLRDYILLIIDDHHQINDIKQNLRNINQAQLAKILEILATKQSQQIKSREELIKFCLRKAFRFIFKKISERDHISKTNLKTARQEFLTIMEQEKKIPLILPFRKNSKNKTMNNDFLKEVFSSQIFQSFYKEFLEHLDDTIQADRKKKIDKLQDKIWLSLRDNKITTFDIKRLPWTHKNTERMKSIAFELLTFSQN